MFASQIAAEERIGALMRQHAREARAAEDAAWNAMLAATAPTEMQ